MEKFNFCAVLSYTHDTHAVKNVHYIKTTEDLETAAVCICSSKKVFLKIFCKFHWKTPVLESLLIHLQANKTSLSIKK